MKVLRTLVELSFSALEATYNYYAPDDCPVVPFVRVRIKFGRMNLIGFVLSVNDSPLTPEEYQAEHGYQIKAIDAVIDSEPLLNPELIALGKTLSETTFSTLIQCYQAFLPGGMKPKGGKGVKAKYQNVYFATPHLATGIEGISLTPNQKQCYQYLVEHPDLTKADIPFSNAIISALIKKRAIRAKAVEVHRGNAVQVKRLAAPQLTNAQQTAINEIRANPGPFLLHGVTGSGKTEIYIQAVNDAIKQGKTALILLPEIALTTQLIQTYLARLDGVIAIFHSGLSDGARFDEYRRVMRQQVQVVIGTRSAVFTPLTNIGVIIIDEEHASSYKQDSPSPRYHAREVALIRAKTHQAKVIMGSATPSIEAYTYAKVGRYHLLTLPERINALALPSVELVDLTKEARAGHYQLLSRPLLKAIETCLANREQVVILTNRRGYAPSMYCRFCQTMIECPNCRIPLVYHKEDQELTCHRCSYQEDVPSRCPTCGAGQLRPYGVGIQRVEELLTAAFPAARIVRYDRDTTRNEGDHQSVVTRMVNEEIDILLGTQMVAKGFNFPRVSLIGVIMAEQGLSTPFFRAGETTFQLLTQVIGRAGRFDIPGKAIIQTYKPQARIINFAINQDYQGFYQHEVGLRKARAYPPFNHLFHIVLIGPTASDLFTQGRMIKELLTSTDPTSRVSDPHYPYINFRAGEYRVYLSVLCKNTQVFAPLLAELRKMKQINLGYINVNPYEGE